MNKPRSIYAVIADGTGSSMVQKINAQTCLEKLMVANTAIRKSLSPKPKVKHDPRTNHRRSSRTPYPLGDGEPSRQPGGCYCPAVWCGGGWGYVWPMILSQLLPHIMRRLRILKKLGAPASYTVEVEYQGEWWRVSVERVDG